MEREVMRMSEACGNGGYGTAGVTDFRKKGSRRAWRLGSRGEWGPGLMVGLLTSVAVGLLLPVIVEAYRLRVSGMEYIPGDGENPPLISALAEPRTLVGTTGTEITRFHTGVDVPLVQKTPIQPIEGGVVTMRQP